jgi:uncharacterized membrane protein (UPF0127 family)
MNKHKIPFHEPVSIEIINSKLQKFIFWVEPAYNLIDIYQALNYRKQIYQSMLLCLPKGESHIHFLHSFHFAIDVLLIKSTGIIYKTYNLPPSSKSNEVSIEGAQYVLLAPLGFYEQFSIKDNNSSLGIKEIKKIEVTENKVSDLNLYQLTSEQIAKHVLEDKSGNDLRSRIPSIYVWYHDLVFFIDNFGFPGYSASAPMKDSVKDAIILLQQHNISPILRDASYPRIFFNRLFDVTCFDTWWGMENHGKFIQRNWINSEN